MEMKDKSSQNKFRSVSYNSLAVLFGTIVALVLLGIAEVAARGYLKVTAGKRPPLWEYVYNNEPLSLIDPQLGFAAKPGAAVPVVRRRGEQVAYQVTWHTDHMGRRIVPLNVGGERVHAALFFGCSFTFGEGVDDKDTLPARFAAHAADYLPYNYGFMGYGPQHMFLQLDRDSIFSDIQEPVQLVVYTFIPHQMDRLIGRMRVSTTWGGTLPCLTRSEKGIEFRGSFEDSGLWRQSLYSLASRSALLKTLKIDLPIRITASHYEFAAEVVLASALKVKARFPQARFLVLIYPRESSASEAGQAFSARGLEVLQLDSELPSDFAMSPKYNLPDRHPTAASYELVAAALARYLASVKEVP